MCGILSFVICILLSIFDMFYQSLGWYKTKYHDWGDTTKCKYAIWSHGSLYLPLNRALQWLFQGGGDNLSLALQSLLPEINAETIPGHICIWTLTFELTTFAQYNKPQFGLGPSYSIKCHSLRTTGKLIQDLHTMPFLEDPGAVHQKQI